jgi:hypothetical protein
MIEKIRRNLMLREYDVKETPSGRQSTFSIKFIKQNGELVFIPNAVACGLNVDMAKNRLRGVLPIDLNGNKTGHPTPVNIDSIIEWNGKTVVL